MGGASKTGGGRGTNQHAVKGTSSARAKAASRKPSVPAAGVPDGVGAAAEEALRQAAARLPGDGAVERVDGGPGWDRWTVECVWDTLAVSREQSWFTPSEVWTVARADGGDGVVALADPDHAALAEVLRRAVEPDWGDQQTPDPARSPEQFESLLAGAGHHNAPRLVERQGPGSWTVAGPAGRVEVTAGDWSKRDVAWVVLTRAGGHFAAPNTQARFSPSPRGYLSHRHISAVLELWCDGEDG
jgi:hypothetical protein